METIKIKKVRNHIPVKITTRALADFGEMTGYGMMNVESMTNMSFGDGARLIYCAAKAGCKAEGIEFKHTIDDYIDNVLTDLNDFQNALVVVVKVLTEALKDPDNNENKENGDNNENAENEAPKKKE